MGGSGSRTGDDEERGKGLGMAEEGVGAGDAVGEKHGNIEAEGKGGGRGSANGHEGAQQHASSP